MNPWIAFQTTQPIHDRCHFDTGRIPFRFPSSNTFCQRVFLKGSVLLGLAMSLASIGCGSSSPSATGTVTYDGETIKQGNITFAPKQGGPIVGGEIKDGKYYVKDLSIGTSRVSVIAVKDVPMARSSEDMARMAEEQRIKGNDNGLIDPADIIPENAVGNNQDIEIKAGSQVLDFKLSKPKK